jgi:hypothetical protein
MRDANEGARARVRACVLCFQTLTPQRARESRLIPPGVVFSHLTNRVDLNCPSAILDAVAFVLVDLGALELAVSRIGVAMLVNVVGAVPDEMTHRWREQRRVRLLEHAVLDDPVAVEIKRTKEAIDRAAPSDGTLVAAARGERRLVLRTLTAGALALRRVEEECRHHEQRRNESSEAIHHGREPVRDWCTEASLRERAS